MDIKQLIKNEYGSPLFISVKRYIKRHKGLVAAGILIIAAVVLLIVFFAYRHIEEENNPELHLKSDSFERYVGDTVMPADFLESVEDDSAVMLSFLTEGNSYTFEEEGTTALTILAVNAEGQHQFATVEVTATKKDLVSPVITGAENDVLLQKGDAFDVMEGVTATDETDHDLSFKVVPEEIDTSQAGTHTVVYRAVDASGNEDIVVRHVMIAEEMLTYEDTEYPIFWSAEGVGDHPYLIAVNREMNTVTVFARDEDGRYTVPYKAFVCSVGDDTPTGYFYTLERYRWQDLYDNAWGQYATRIVDHILFHSVPYYSKDPSDLEYDQYNLLGTHASLGCVRLTVEDAKWIYDNTEEGFPCVIYDDTLFEGPLGKPESIQIDEEDIEKRGWDPTDPNEENPWNW